MNPLSAKWRDQAAQLIVDAQKKRALAQELVRASIAAANKVYQQTDAEENDFVSGARDAVAKMRDAFADESQALLELAARHDGSAATFLLVAQELDAEDARQAAE